MLFLRSVLSGFLNSLFIPKSTLRIPNSSFAFTSFFLRLACLLVHFLIFASVVSAAQITLAWNSNAEPDLEGYAVYHSIGSPGPPYDFIETLPEVDLPDPLNPKLIITDLKEGLKHYFAVTAYDTEGNESDFSNDVCVEVLANSIENCSAAISPSIGSSSGGGGSGRACFISTATDGSSPNPLFSILRKLLGPALAIMFLLLLLIRSGTAPRLIA